MTFSKYPEYKDSGVEWLGEVPMHWTLKDLKYCCDVIPSNVDKKSHPDERPVRLCNYTDVYYNNRITSDLEFMKATARKEEVEKFQLEINDVAITKDSESADDIAVPAIVSETVPGVLCGYHLAIIRAKKDAIGVFLNYLFQSDFLRYYFEITARGLTRVGLSESAIGNSEIAWPSVSEQERIAAFLDHETARIDALIEEQKRLIELLKEKRQAVISHAVTKGLDPDMPMKDSGVEWLGEVPAHWIVGKIKWYISTASGGTPSSSRSEDYYGGEIPWLRSLDLSDGVVTGFKVSVTAKALKETSCRMVPAGSVLIAMYGGDGTIGKNGLLKFDSAINQALCAFIPTEFLMPEYLHKYFQFYRPYWMIGAESSRKDPNIGQDRIGDNYCLIPPRHEQATIVARLDQDLNAMGDLQTEAAKLVANLQERRSALISAAVTGKIDVRNWRAFAESEAESYAMAAEPKAAYESKSS